MSDEQNDPSGNTAAFQAFVRSAASGDPELAGGRGSRLGIFIAVAAAAIVVIGLLALAFAG